MKAKFCLLTDNGLLVGMEDNGSSVGTALPLPDPKIAYDSGRVVLLWGETEAEIPPAFVGTLLAMDVPGIVIYRLDAEGYAGEFAGNAVLSLTELYDAKVIMNYERCKEEKETKPNQD